MVGGQLELLEAECLTVPAPGIGRRLSVRGQTISELSPDLACQVVAAMASLQHGWVGRSSWQQEEDMLTIEFMEALVHYVDSAEQVKQMGQVGRGRE